MASASKLCKILSYEVVSCQEVFAVCQALFERNSYYEIIYNLLIKGIEMLYNYTSNKEKENLLIIRSKKWKIKTTQQE